jgi:radical SAM family uncharacterized protein/radical SAM-linked protein
MSELRKRLEREVLPLVARPSRYVGGERNVPEKDPGDVRLRFLLAFPDVYEIGMSHLGIRVLYDILNRRPEVAAERTFAPWTDMEDLMRERRLPLFSWETHTPASEFDVIGFTLQYELHYSNVLTMLDLAGIPLRAAERGVSHPLVVGGGPCAFNPEPMAPFFDLFVVGDGETAVLELADLVLETKGALGADRVELLRRASRIPGVYVPSLYEPASPGGPADGALRRAVVPVDPEAPDVVSGRVEPVLDGSNHPVCPVVPLTEATHDRLAVEIMRGCTRGCRFCQAGMVTRPVRSRPVEDLVGLVERGIDASGYDEVSLVSLSASDYDELAALVSRLNEKLFDRRVSISLPSLRVDRFGLELADGIGRVRKAGLTFAPEAGTQRLRDVINKNESEDHILETVDVAFASGWNRVKLYFMIGLPTETDEDLEGIVDLVRKIRAVGREHKKGARINVSISPFVPKPHTPFQWEKQDTIEETRRKERLLRERLRMKGVKLSLRDPEVSFLEGVMARGDRRVAAAIEAAWRGGARFDSWTETFDFDVWRRAFEETGVEPDAYLEAIPDGTALPWGHIDAGPTSEFLLAEREKALDGTTTPDCREAGCFDCGACEDARVVRVGLPETVGRGDASDRAPGFGRRERRIRNGSAADRWRVRYEKGDAIRFLSHLDVVRAVLRAVTMSGIPIAHSQGFNPHPKVSFGPPLPVGATGEAEFFEMELLRAVGEHEIASRLSERLPPGLRLISVTPVQSKVPVAAQAAAAEYVVSGVAGLAGLSAEEVGERLEAVRRVPSVEIHRGEKTRVVRPSEHIIELDPAGDDPTSIRTVLALGEKGSVRPVDLVRLLAPEVGRPGGHGESGEPGDVEDGQSGPYGEESLARVHRVGLLRRRTTGRPGLEPIQ